MNRKKRKKVFNRLERTENPFVRKCRSGHLIDIRDYGKENETGWIIVDNEAQHWSEKGE